MKKIIFLAFILLSFSCTAQEKAFKHFFTSSDTLNKSRLLTVSIVQGGIWAGSLLALNQAWYANYPRGSFHLFNDSGEWLQVDKVGHAYSAYWAAGLSSQMFRWSGLPRRKSALLGAGMGIAYESVIEILDGFSTQWGFSIADMAANTSGSLLFAAQELAWEEQRISFKFSAHRNLYNDPELLVKANQLYGASLPERILKDYNGQTYWLSANLHSFAPDSKIPRWLNIAVGYGATGMFGGYDNMWVDDDQQFHDRRDIARVRQFYFSPDIDLSRVRIKGKTPRVFKILNEIKLKFPLPALELNSKGRFTFHPVFF